MAQLVLALLKDPGHQQKLYILKFIFECLHLNQFEPPKGALIRMRLTKFLFIIEKITIIIVVLTFIPIALFAFASQKVEVPDNLQKAYSILTSQLELKGFLTSIKNISECQTPSSRLFYQPCFKRCTRQNDCLLIKATDMQSCGQSYTLGNYRFCSVNAIKNQVTQKTQTGTSFVLDKSSPPLAHITTNQNNVLSLQYYCLYNLSDCSSLYSTFGTSIKQKFEAKYHEYHTGISYMIYFGLIPLVAHIIFVVILDLLKKFNLRVTNSLLIIHEALIGIGIVIMVIKYDQQISDFKNLIQNSSNSCFIKDGSFCQKTIYQNFLNFKGQHGISSSFVKAMMFILVLQILCLLVILVVNILIVKYYQLRERDPQNQGYQLQSL